MRCVLIEVMTFPFSFLKDAKRGQIISEGEREVVPFN
jgi:hypothetical protein